MNKTEVEQIEGQAASRNTDSPTQREKEYIGDPGELSTQHQLAGEDLTNQVQYEDIEPILHWR